MLLDGHAWRLFLLHDREDALWILVSERGDVRGELVGKIARRSLLPDLVGLPLLALLIWLAVGWGLRPLARMAQLLKSRDPTTSRRCCWHRCRRSWNRWRPRSIACCNRSIS